MTLRARVELAKALAQTGADKEAADLLGPALAAGYPDEKGALHALLARALRKLGREAEAAKAEAEARRLSDAFQARQWRQTGESQCKPVGGACSSIGALAAAGIPRQMDPACQCTGRGSVADSHGQRSSRGRPGLCAAQRGNGPQVPG